VPLPDIGMATTAVFDVAHHVPVVPYIPILTIVGTGMHEAQITSEGLAAP